MHVRPPATILEVVHYCHFGNWVKFPLALKSCRPLRICSPPYQEDFMKSLPRGKGSCPLLDDFPKRPCREETPDPVWVPRFVAEMNVRFANLVVGHLSHNPPTSLLGSTPLGTCFSGLSPRPATFQLRESNTQLDFRTASFPVIYSLFKSG